jgi:hypothetical protein
MDTESTPVWLLVLLPLVFLAFFPLMWCGVLWINSRIGGWSRLARHYRSTGIPHGRTFHSVQGQVGIVSYRAALECTTNEHGLFIQPWAIFRFAHPLLFIPWSEMHGVNRTSLLWIPVVRAEIGKPRVAVLRLAAKVFEDSEGRRLLP